jgi:alkenylglycerophosphocholine hydrolase
MTGLRKAIAAVAAVLICGTLAIVGTERDLFGLTILFKPLATLLLLVVVGRPATHYARIVWVGIFFSLAGDIALLSDADVAFEIGLSAFLLAHISYVFANLSVARWSWRVAIVALVFIASTAVLLRLARPAEVSLQEATLVYGTAITLMVVSASATLGGPLGWARLAALGAVLFYVSDSSLALNRFHRPIPHVSFLTLGVYWLGQLGIALAARGPVARRG